ncbi:MAG: phenylacetate--CoA ligase [Kiritimatiellae bacterium]|jgi:phenylacetate-CoA ligase|nr:phenylacetate--CoA ligase [Kiritimatiellia bacterium]
MSNFPIDTMSGVDPVSIPDFMSPEGMRALQLTKLKKLVKTCYERVPLTRRRMDEKGVKPEDIKTLEDIKLLPFMMKTDLRDEYPLGLTAAPMSEVVRFHCSSGTTGKPIVICNTKKDIEVWSDGVARSLAMDGIGKDDILQVSYGYGLFTGGLGLHYGGELRGCTVLPTSGGNTDRQLMLMRDLGVTVIACTPSYFIHLMDEAQKKGIDFRRDMKLKHGIFGAEPWTDEMRERIECETGIEAHDIYGLTEISGPGVASSCGCHEGLHVFEDHFYPEIIDPDTLEPLPDGEWGELVFSTLDRTGTPMLRYRTRDITRIIPGVCKCGRTIRRIDRISARSDDMLIIRGVNVFPSQIEAGLMSVDKALPHYHIYVDREGDLDNLEVKIEVTSETISDDIKSLELLRRNIAAAIQKIINISIKVTLVEPNSLPRSEGKLNRVTDYRKIKK